MHSHNKQALERMSQHPPDVDHFAIQVRSFLAWCHAGHTGKTAAKMQLEALQQLAQLYSAALRLPRADFLPAPEPPSQTEEERRQLAANLRQLPFQYYWKVFTPTDMDEKEREPVCGDLFDDFLDIYGDVAAGLWLYDRKHFEAAEFSWSQMFVAHWGRHAVSALHALHSFEPTEERDAF
jgi:hypothetical protein